MDEKELIKVCKSSASGSGSRNFLKGFFRIADRAFFHNLAHISGKTDISHLLNFGNYLEPETGSGLRIQTPDLD